MLDGHGTTRWLVLGGVYWYQCSWLWGTYFTLLPGDFPLLARPYILCILHDSLRSRSPIIPHVPSTYNLHGN